MIEPFAGASSLTLSINENVHETTLISSAQERQLTISIKRIPATPKTAQWYLGRIVELSSYVLLGALIFLAMKFLDWNVIPYVLLIILVTAGFWLSIVTAKLGMKLQGKLIQTRAMKSRFGLAVQATAFAFLLCGLLLVPPFFSYFSQNLPWLPAAQGPPVTFLQGLATILLAFASAWLAVVFYRMGRRLRILPVERAMKEDVRPPVVYLRAFFQDAALGEFECNSEPGLFLVEAWGEMKKRSLEEQVVRRFFSLGPVHSLGKPGELLAPSGAIRHYVADDKWKEVVADMMDRSCATIIRLASTVNVKWECDYALEKLAPEQVMLLVTASRKENHQEVWDAFREQFGDGFPQGLPSKLSSHSFSDIGNAYLLGFDQDWSPRKLPLLDDSHDGLSRNLDRMAFAFAVFAGIWMGLDLYKKILEFVGIPLS